MILKYFLPKYMHSNVLKLRDALEEFSIISQFLGSKKKKINFLKKLRILSAVFIESKLR